MSILQISKLQQRSGNLVDLPQLDEGEFGWASDNNRLFIGKTSPNQNVEVLTAYSNISFSQIDGSIGNLNMNPVTIAAGEVLVYDGTNWVNRGGIAGGSINLGNISNVTISGGAIGYILQTDGLGNLSWTPKGTILSFVENVTQANPGVVTTTSNHNLTKGAAVTITGSQGMTQLNGNSYYANVLTPTTFSLYTDAGATSSPLNTTSYTAYAYTTVSNTVTSVNTVIVGNSAVLSVNKPVQFIGNMSTSGIVNNTTYYINSIPSGTSITISSSLYPNGTAGPVLALQTANGLSASVYETGGQITSLVGGGSGGTGAAGTNTQVQFNNAGILGATSSLTFDFANNILTVGGNANVANLNSSGIVSAVTLSSNVATGTAPITVNSTTKVANLNADLLDGYNTSVTSSANTIVVRDANSNVSGGNLTASGIVSATGNVSGGNVNTTGLVSATGNVTGGNLTTTGLANVGSLSATGNISGGNVNTTGLVSATGNISGGNVNTTGLANVGSLSATGNISGGNVNTTGLANLGSLVVPGTSNLGPVGNVTITGGTSGYYLQTNGSGGLSWQPISSGTTLVSGNSNVTIAANANVNISSNGVANVFVVTGTGVNVAGKLNTGGNITTNGTISVNTPISPNYLISANTANNWTAIGGYSNIGFGVSGLSNIGIGVYGSSNAQPGVSGMSASSSGVEGISVSSYGVQGISTISYGVYGNSTSNIAIFGDGGTNVGIFGNSSTNIGVIGNSNTNFGIKGVSFSSYGVFGQSIGNVGVFGEASASHAGVQGDAQTTGSMGVLGTASSSGVYGVVGQLSSINGIAAVYGVSSVPAANGGGVGGLFSAPDGEAVSAQSANGIALVAGTRTGVALEAISTSSGTALQVTSASGPVATFGNNATTFVSIDSAGNLNVSNNISGNNVSATSHYVFSVAGAVSAAGSTQGTATALTNDFNVVSTVSSGANGVSLPTAVAGYRITILNTSANILNVYPLGNGIINSQAANVAYAQPAGARLDFICTATATAPGGQWYTLNATYD